MMNTSRAIGPLTSPWSVGISQQSTIGGFPDKAVVRLSWTNYNNFATVTTAQRVEYSMNSVFDPGQGAGTTQPANFDIFATIYNYYRVHKVTAQFRITQNQTIPTNAGGTVVSYQANSRLAITPLAESSVATISNLWSNPRSFVTDVTYAKPLVYTRTWHVPAVVGLTNQQYADSDRTSALVSADPVQQAYINLTVGTADNTNAVAFIDVDANFTYEVEFFDRIPWDLDLYLKRRNDFASMKAKIKVGTKSAPALPQRVTLSEVKTESKTELKSRFVADDFSGEDYELLDRTELEKLRQYKAAFLGGSTQIGAGLTLTGASGDKTPLAKASSAKGRS